VLLNRINETWSITSVLWWEVYRPVGGRVWYERGDSENEEVECRHRLNSHQGRNAMKTEMRWICCGEEVKAAVLLP
jgi:hypothetical protein